MALEAWQDRMLVQHFAVSLDKCVDQLGACNLHIRHGAQTDVISPVELGGTGRDAVFVGHGGVDEVGRTRDEVVHSLVVGVWAGVL